MYGLKCPYFMTFLPFSLGFADSLIILPTVKPVLSDHSKIDKTKVLKTFVSFMQVEGIAECSLLTCIKR